MSWKGDFGNGQRGFVEAQNRGSTATCRASNLLESSNNDENRDVNIKI